MGPLRGDGGWPSPRMGGEMVACARVLAFSIAVSITVAVVLLLLLL